jgi:tRNA pseudouridine38-40 synthase
MPVRNIKLTLSYDGTDFHGWQVQPEKPTIQGTLADAIERITGEWIAPQGSGRTDAGVHAYAQVASFTTSSSIPSDNLRKALNSLLPPTVRVITTEDADLAFHPRFHAKAKTYEYRIYLPEVCSPFHVKHVYHYPYPLQTEAMEKAAELVIGDHDFTSFAAVDPEKRAGNENAANSSNVRTLFESSWKIWGKEYAIYTVRGSGFLHHMVRNLVGTFLLVGKGTLQPADITRILDAKDRSAAGPTAPPQGLFLVSVEY